MVAAPERMCAPQAVAGLGPRRPRRASGSGCARRRPSRGWGPAGRGAPLNQNMRAAGRRGAGAPPAEARLWIGMCAPQAVAGLGPRRPRRASGSGCARRRPSRGWGPAGRGAPLDLIDCGPMTEPRLPLHGIRVLELAQVVAGPFCGALMAEFGAEVIKTEMPGRGDDLRRLGPTEDGCTYWFAVDNRNKKLMTLDLHSAKGQEIVRRLVPQCDVVL